MLCGFTRNLAAPGKHNVAGRGAESVFDCIRRHQNLVAG
jgi:hypothetical protein